MHLPSCLGSAVRCVLIYLPCDYRQLHFSHLPIRDKLGYPILMTVSHPSDPFLPGNRMFIYLSVPIT